MNFNTIGLRPHMQSLDWQIISPEFSLEVKRLSKLDHIKVEELIAKVYLCLTDTSIHMTESFESIFAFISMVTLYDFSTAPKIKLEVVYMYKWRRSLIFVLLIVCWKLLLNKTQLVNPISSSTTLRVFREKREND